MKNKFILGLTLSLALLSASCSGSKEEVAAPKNDMETIDFEGMSYFNTGIGQLTTKFSRSGKWAIKVDSLNIYSLTYNRPYGDILNKQYKSAKISVWFKATNPNITDASLVASVTDLEGTMNYAYAISYFAQFEENKKKTNTDKAGWKKAEIKIDFPATTAKPSVLKIYAWSPKQEEVHLDDFEIEYFK
jgi:hypothetical protein